MELTFGLPTDGSLLALSTSNPIDETSFEDRSLSEELVAAKSLGPQAILFFLVYFFPRPDFVCEEASRRASVHCSIKHRVVSFRKRNFNGSSCLSHISQLEKAFKPAALERRCSNSAQVRLAGAQPFRISTEYVATHLKPSSRNLEPAYK